ncbi:MAG: ATP-binding protein [Chloroflexota bacterium]
MINDQPYNFDKEVVTESRKLDQERLKRRLLWDRLTMPSDTVVDIEHRRRAQFLASSLLFLIPIALVGLVLATSTSPPQVWEQQLITLTMFSVILGLIGIYFLSRTQHYKIAASAVVVLLFGGAIGLSIYDPTESTNLLPYLALVGLVTSLLFSARTTLLTVIVINIGGVIVMMSNNVVTFDDEIDIIVFNVITGALIVAAVYIRTQYIQRIEYQTTKLDQLVLQLAAARANLEQRVEDRTRQLKDANEELKRFAYILSHDLRNHLVNFNGFTQELGHSVSIIQEYVPEILPHLEGDKADELTEAIEEDIPEFLQIIDTSVGQMKRMVDAMLVLAREENRALKLEYIDTKQVVDDVLTSLSVELRENDIEVKVGHLPKIKADRFALERIFTNLIHNAVIYAEPSRRSEIFIGSTSEGNHASFYVQDNGIGIHEEDLEKIFDIFSRSGGNNVEGDGMGLAFVRNLVQRHSGTVRCQSVLGIGSKFTFTIRMNLDEQHDVVADKTRIPNV